MRNRAIRITGLVLASVLLLPGGGSSAGAPDNRDIVPADGVVLVAAPSPSPATPSPAPLPAATPDPTPVVTPSAVTRGQDWMPARPPVVQPTPRAVVERATPKPAVATPKPAVATPKPAAPTPKPVATYAGRNHLWAPSLGISADWKRVADCLVAIPNGLIDWRCSGMTDPSNLYLAAHNTSTFASFRRAFLDGKMQPGMRVVTADAKGGIHHWRLAWVKKLTKAEANADPSIWGAAPGGGRVMTWQTCYDIGSAAVLIIARWVPEG